MKNLVYQPLPISEEAQSKEYREENYAQFWYFIYERHNIWHKRFVLQQSKPWTEDKIMQEYKFTNVYRELDKGSIYLLDNLIPRIEIGNDASEKLFLLNLMAYRFLNKWESWEACVGYLTNWDEPERSRFCTALNQHKEEKGPVFTAAHMLPPLTGVAGRTKVERLATLLDEIWLNIDQYWELVKQAQSLKEVFDYVSGKLWWGKFLAYEVSVDITYTDISSLTEDEWVSAGPGCRRGIERIFPGQPKKPEAPVYPALIKRLRNEQFDAWEKYNLPFPSIAYKGRYMTLRNIEHCLCEFDKYNRTFTGESHPKQKFVEQSLTSAMIDRLGDKNTVTWKDHV